MQNPTRKQIQVLADLNAVTEAYIEKVLIDAGIKVPERQRKKKEMSELEILVQKECIADVVVESLTEAMIQEQETIDFHKDRLRKLKLVLDDYKKKSRFA